jgi:ligand-binding sensor domain-containing protein
MTALLALILTGASVQSWEHYTHFGSIGSMAVSGSTLVAATSGGVAFATLSGSSLAWDSVWAYPGEISSSDCREIVIEPGPPLRYWVGTWGGGIDIYTPWEGWQHIGQLEGLPVHQEISSICIVDTTVFAGTSEGLAIKQYGYFQTWTELNTGGGLPSDFINCLQACDSGLYVGTSLGLALLVQGGYPGSADSWVQDSTMASRAVRGMCFSGDTLLAATDEGLWFKAPGASFAREPGYPGSSPLCVSASGGRIVCGEDAAMAVRVGGAWDYWEAVPGQLCRDAIFLGDSLVLAGLTNRLSSQKDCGLGLARGWQDYWVSSYAEGLTANDVRSISVGPEGDLWAATNHVGLNVLSGGDWTSFHDIFPSEHQMFAVAALPGGGVFVSHYYFGVTYLDWAGTPESSDDVHFTWDTFNSGLLNNQITALSAGADGTVWFGQEPFYATPSEPSGVSRLQWTEGEPSTSVWTSWTPSTGLPSGRVAAVVDAGAGTAWAGTEAGLVLVGPGAYDVSQVIGVGQGLPSADVRSLALSRDGRLYAGTTSGLAVVEPGSFAATAVPDADGTILSVYCDHLGAVWAAGTDALYRVDPDGSVEAYNVYNSPLLSTLVYGLAGDANAGLLFLATDHGIWELDLGNGLSAGTGAVLFPNPFLPGRGEVLGIAGLPDVPTTIRVFDLNGGLVYECSSPDRDGIAWDGAGDDGEPVATGIYVVEVEQAGFAGLLKLAIVR